MNGAVGAGGAVGTTHGRLVGRLIGLGVTGSIAAFKAVELLRLLSAEGADVSVMMTPAATRFVAPLTFAALSRHPVETDLLELLPDERIGHIVIADTADAIVVAPATAHWLGAMANGLAADVVTATVLASSASVVVAPAMDGDMWTHPATQANVARLREGFGYVIVEPGVGELASGQSGTGRLAELSEIVDAIVHAVSDRPVRAPQATHRPPIADPVRDADLAGRHIVVSAGGTREAIDPVRFIGNRSTGKMGMAVAGAALDRGARVTVVVANLEVAVPTGASVIRVESTRDMRDALVGITGDGSDALVMAAAVADFRPVAEADRKLERGAALTLELEATPDILAEIARTVGVPRPILVGFSAETGSLDRAADKLKRKGVDFLVANDVSEAGSGFGTDTNRVAILAADGSRDDLALMSKRAVADEILDRVALALDARDAARQTGT
ncbi:MAG: bifunctional phosphopantothenoylcysteine decarboxylase/phosphopantothenate--cysteine ligase CoaBC [Candidatus Limnocylindrales bacterium]